MPDKKHLHQLLEQFGSDLTTFLAEGRHTRGARLMTLHELNVAFGRHLQRPSPGGTAARLLPTVAPELREQMRMLALRGYLLKGAA